MGIILAIKWVNIATKTSKERLRKISKHYPHRDVSNLSVVRIAEHEAVICCLHEILGGGDWWIEHELNGAPFLYKNGINCEIAISISHAIENNTVAYAAVILGDSDIGNNSRIGVDLVIKGDKRIERISQRVMRQEEIDSGRLEEVWACKEAMFKALGPGLDFIQDLEVNFISEDLISGNDRKWRVINQDNVVVVYGPVQVSL